MTNTRLMVVLVTAGVCLILSLILLVSVQRAAGCERGRLDRSDNAVGWRTAEQARRASGSANDLRAAERYDRIASRLEQRSRVSCSLLP